MSPFLFGSLAVLGCFQGITAASDDSTMLKLNVGATNFQIEPWGNHSLRVRANYNGSIVDLPGRGALLPIGSDNKGASVRQSTFPTSIVVDGNSVTNGDIKATVSDAGLVTISRTVDGSVVLTETFRTGSATPAPTPPPSPNAGSKTVSVNQPDVADCSGGRCCLDLSNWNTEDYATVGISNCHSPNEYPSKGHNQYWTYSASAKTMTVAIDGKCLEYNSTTSKVDVNECSSNSQEQQWTISANASTHLKHSSGDCLAILGRAVDGGKLGLVTCDDSSALQSWTFADANSTQPVQPTTTDVAFFSAGDELLFGFGEHQQGRLQLKGVGYDMESCLVYGKSHGGEVCLPWVIGASKSSGVNYGFLWNMPNYGGVDFGQKNTSEVRWSAQVSTQTDYFITIPESTSTPSTAGNQVMHSYVDAVGHAPMLPDYAKGYWHSKNRYTSQDDILTAARNFHNRSINVSIIVIDYNHWPLMGDWAFDPVAWPDVPAMMAELGSYGMKVMVSAWPFSAVNSTSFTTIRDQGLAFTVQGSDNSTFWNDNNCADTGGVRDRPCFVYDPTQKAARSYFWSRLHEGYYKFGIKIFWLDASEPEISTKDAAAAAGDYNSSLGSGQETGMMFPYYHTQSIHDGLMSEGETEVVMLTRSAWAGMQRFGAALWSGDTQSTWKSLKVSIQAGLNTQLSGIAWWTTDIGGYSGGNPSDPGFRELIVRWFQFGLTCPLFRQHGARDTDPWGYGNESLAAIEGIIQLRETFRPYLTEILTEVSTTGQPINRPLWWDFPEDVNTWDIDNSYMFGPKYLVCPVTESQAQNWPCYLPKLANGAKWKHFFNGQMYDGGNVTTATPLTQFPLFQRTDM